MTTQRQIERQKRALERRTDDVHWWRAESMRWQNTAIDAPNKEQREDAIDWREHANVKSRLAERECATLRRKLGISTTDRPGVSNER